MSDGLATRIKRYEKVSNHHLTPRSPLLIRVDGRAFHTLTRGCVKPFDHTLINGMIRAAIETSRDMAGFKLAYCQSDEVTFLLTDFDDLQTQGWFGYELNKVVSLSASLFTAYFAQTHTFPGRVATFDSRAFNVPLDDAPNVFIWRQQDWERNSLQMVARTHFSQKQLHGKKRQDIHEMLHGIGENWARRASIEKNGTFILHDRSLVHAKADYNQIMDWIISPILKGWPGYCQNCKTALTPPDRRDCPSCGADDFED